MTAAPVWLQPSDVIRWLQLAAPTEQQAELIADCCAAVEPQVQRARPDQWSMIITAETGTERFFHPDPEVYQAGVMLAARLWRRRNSPGGIEAFAESLAYVSRYDPEIERALRVGAWRVGRAR